MGLRKAPTAAPAGPKPPPPPRPPSWCSTGSPVPPIIIAPMDTSTPEVSIAKALDVAETMAARLCRIQADEIASWIRQTIPGDEGRNELALSIMQKWGSSSPLGS